MTQEAALAAGHTQEQVDAYQTIQGLIIGRNAEGEVTRQQFCQTLMKHDENDATRTKLGLSAPTEGETVTPVATFRAAFEEAAKGMDGGADAKTTASKLQHSWQLSKPPPMLQKLSLLLKLRPQPKQQKRKHLQKMLPLRSLHWLCRSRNLL